MEAYFYLWRILFNKKFKLFVICQANGVLKQNNCVCQAVLTTVELFQYNVHNYFLYKHRWSDRVFTGVAWNFSDCLEYVMY